MSDDLELETTMLYNIRTNSVPVAKKKDNLKIVNTFLFWFFTMSSHTYIYTT
jgi:hypothetical protein